MNFDKRFYDRLTRQINREPNEQQVIDNKNVKVYILEENEQSLFLKNEKAKWAMRDKEVCVAVAKDYYEYGSIREFYSKEVNKEYLNFIGEINNIQKKLIYPIMGSILIIYIIVAALAMTVIRSDYQLYVIIGALVLVFVAVFFINRFITKKTDLKIAELRKKIIDILGDQKAQKIDNDKAEYRRQFNQGLSPEPENVGDDLSQDNLTKKQKEKLEEKIEKNEK